MLGPGFVAAIAYMDPGNVATNSTAGSRYGYLLVWVVIVANLMASVVQYLSARIGLLSGRSLPRLVGDRARPGGRWAYWLQAQCVAMATDVAEIVGGALGLQLLFGIPLGWGGLLTFAVSTVVLHWQKEGQQKVFERIIIAMMLVIAIGLLAGLFFTPVRPGELVAGLVPRFAGADSVTLAAGMLGATVMPHAVYLHSSLVRHRHGQLSHRDAFELLRTTRFDIVCAMAMAGAVNLGLLMVAASALRGHPAGDTIEGIHAALGAELGPTVAIMFGVGLLFSGFASTAVGSYAGSEVMAGLLKYKTPVMVRRGLTAAPSLIVLALGVPPTEALILSQIVLSFGIPFALIPLIRFNRSAELTDDHPLPLATTVMAWAIAAAIIALNLTLIWLTVAPG